MNWEIVLAFCAVAGITSSATGALMRLFFRATLAEFKVNLMNDLNGRYMSSRLAEQQLATLSDQVSTLQLALLPIRPIYRTDS